MWSEQFIDKKSRLITIKIDADSGHAEAWDGTALVGHLDWSMHAVGLDWQGESIEGALLTNIYLDNAPGYTKSGIGTRIVELIREQSGVEVFVCKDIGTTRSDGAHPTGDAPGFYESLTRKALAHWCE